MLRNWIKIALSNYKRNLLSTVINLFGLTIGLTGFMLILMHWQDEKSYEAWNPGKENIYFLETVWGKILVSGVLLLRLRCDMERKSKWY